MSDHINAIAISATIAASLAAGAVAFVVSLICMGFIPAVIVGSAAMLASTVIVYTLAKPVYMVVQRNSAGF